MHAGVVPAVPIPADEQLMPCPAPGVACHSATKFFAGGSRHGFAVLFGARGVAERLVVQIAAISDQLSEKSNLLIRPTLGGDWLWKRSGDREAVTASELGNGCPASTRKELVLRGRPDRSSAREPNREDGPRPDGPDSLGLRLHDLPLRRDREHLRRGLDELPDRHPPAVRQQHEGVAGDTLAKIRKLRLEVARLTRFDRA